MYYTVGKVFSRPFYRYITRSQNFKILVDKTKKICGHLATAKQAGQKNRNGKTIAALFRNIFCECIEGKSCICLLSAMSVGDD